MPQWEIKEFKHHKNSSQGHDERVDDVINEVKRQFGEILPAALDGQDVVKLTEIIEYECRKLRLCYHARRDMIEQVSLELGLFNKNG